MAACVYMVFSNQGSRLDVSVHKLITTTLLSNADCIMLNQNEFMDCDTIPRAKEPFCTSMYRVFFFFFFSTT